MKPRTKRVFITTIFNKGSSGEPQDNTPPAQMTINSITDIT